MPLLGRIVAGVVLLAACQRQTLGEPCKTDDACHADPADQFDFRCVVDQSESVPGQCTNNCDEDAQCHERWGDDSRCEVWCVRTCSADGDCPDGTRCNEQAWCEPPCSSNDACPPNTMCSSENFCRFPAE